MKFKATNEQLEKIALNAVNASAPMGMGFLRFQPKDYSKDDLPGLVHADGISLDYVEGRMVKLHVHKVGEGFYETRDTARDDYQSWVKIYSTPKELIESAGAEVLPEEAI